MLLEEKLCWKLTVACVCVLSSYVFIHLLILNQLHSANKPWFTSSRKAQAFEKESLLFSLANGSQLNLIKIYFILPLDFLIKPLMQKSLIQKRKSPFCNSFFLPLRGKKHTHTTPLMYRLTVFFKHTSSIFNILELLHTQWSDWSHRSLGSPFTRIKCVCLALSYTLDWIEVARVF